TNQMARYSSPTRNQAATAMPKAITADTALAMRRLGRLRTPSMSAWSTWPPSRGSTGSRFKTAQMTLVFMNSPSTTSVGEPCSGGSAVPSAQAAAPSARPAPGPASASPPCRIPAGRCVNRGKRTHPHPRAYAEPDWMRLPGYRGLSRADWESALWQRKNTVKNLAELKEVLAHLLPHDLAASIDRDQRERATMSLLITPHMINTFDE